MPVRAYRFLLRTVRHIFLILIIKIIICIGVIVVSDILIIRVCLVRFFFSVLQFSVREVSADTAQHQKQKDKRPYMPSLGMLTVNALAASDNVLIPVQAQYLSAKGLEQLLQTVNRVKQHINPKLKIDGILLTMVDGRTNYNKEIADLIRETYGKKTEGFRYGDPPFHPCS